MNQGKLHQKIKVKVNKRPIKLNLYLRRQYLLIMGLKIMKENPSILENKKEKKQKEVETGEHRKEL